MDDHFRSVSMPFTYPSFIQARRSTRFIKLLICQHCIDDAAFDSYTACTSTEGYWPSRYWRNGKSYYSLSNLGHTGCSNNGCCGAMKSFRNTHYLEMKKQPSCCFFISK